MQVYNEYTGCDVLPEDVDVAESHGEHRGVASLAEDMESKKKVCAYGRTGMNEC